MPGAALALVVFLFVEDTGILIMGENNYEETVVYTRLQQHITFWNGILRISGRALKPEK